MDELQTTIAKRKKRRKVKQWFTKHYIES